MLRSWLLFTLCAMAASAQNQPQLPPAKIHEIEIHLDGNECDKAPPRIHLVLNDRQTLTAAYQSEGYWKWSGGPIDPGALRGVQLGVRFRGGRTRCRHYYDFPADKLNVGTAKFSFGHCSVGALDVFVNASFDQRPGAPSRVGYRRAMEAGKDDSLDRPCNEDLTFEPNKENLFLGFWKDTETLSITLAGKRSLAVNTLVAKKRGRIPPDGIAVGFHKVTNVWAEQRVKDPAWLSPNEIGLDEKELRKVHFQSLMLRKAED